MGLRASRSGVMDRALAAYLDTQTHLGIQKSTEKSVSWETHDALSPGDNVPSDEEPARPQAAQAPIARASVVEPPREAAVPVQKPPYGAGIAGVMDALTQRHRATPADITKEMGALTKHVWRDLQRLVKQGKVRREGEDYRPVSWPRLPPEEESRHGPAPLGAPQGQQRLAHQSSQRPLGLPGVLAHKVQDAPGVQPEAPPLAARLPGHRAVDAQLPGTRCQPLADGSQEGRVGLSLVFAVAPIPHSSVYYARGDSHLHWTVLWRSGPILGRHSRQQL
jgi:hypothetical protein